MTSSDSKIDVKGFSITLSITAVTFLVGQFYRHVRIGGENLAVTFIYTSLLLWFSNLGAMFNYLLIPISGEFIDLTLLRIDAAVGFHWLDYLRFFSNYPTVSHVLGIAYNLSLPLIILNLLLLGMSGRQLLLCQYVAALMVSALLAIVFWGFYPSFGTTEVYTIPKSIMDTLNPIVGNAYGDYLRALKLDSDVLISPKNIQGIIAFPSYHTIMALLSAYAVLSIKYWRLPLVFINVLVIFAVPLHGGHHLVDVFGGIIFFVITVFIIRYLSRRWFEDSVYFKKTNYSMTMETSV